MQSDMNTSQNGSAKPITVIDHKSQAGKGPGL